MPYNVGVLLIWKVYKAFTRKLSVELRAPGARYYSHLEVYGGSRETAALFT